MSRTVIERLGTGLYERQKAKIPMKRMADPSEVGAACVFLLGEDSSYLTGDTMRLDGGWVSW